MAFPDDDGATPPPSPVPTGQPVAPGDLQPVGLLPLARASGTNLEKSYLKVCVVRGIYSST